MNPTNILKSKANDSSQILSTKNNAGIDIGVSIHVSAGVSISVSALTHITFYDL